MEHGGEQAYQRKKKHSIWGLRPSEDEEYHIKMTMK